MTKLTFEQIKQLNQASRERCLALRKKKTLPRVVREGSGGVYTIKVTDPEPSPLEEE